MKRKGYLSLLLTLAMLLSLALCVGVSAAADAAASPKDQLKLIASQVEALKQNDSANTWYYTVTDLDHDGCLEFVAASQHPVDRSTNLKVWTVSRDGTALSECSLNKTEDESFPDIMTDTVDSYYVKDTDTWYYMVYDNVVVSNAEVYTIKTSVSLKDGVIGYTPYAVEHTVVNNGIRSVSHTDINGISISTDQYNTLGADAFAGAERSNTAFEWLTADKVGNLDRLTESYEVFLGTREPTEIFPVPKPEALGGTAATPTPVPAATPAPTPVPTPVPTPAPIQPIWLTITKNPTNENRNVGGNAIFVACSNVYESLNWTFVSPSGGKYSPANFIAGSGASISGEYSTTITVSKVESWMNGWGAYCTFYYQGQSACTSTAYIYVKENAPTPAPQPVYGSMSGSAYAANGGYTVYLQNGGQVFVDGWKVKMEGEFYDGCSAMVYYTDYPTSSSVYRADIYGNMGLIIVPDYDIHTAYNSDGSTYDTVACPYCGRQVSMAYDDCPYCGHSMTYSYEIHTAFNPDGSTYNTVTCPYCGWEVSMAYEHCPNCGNKM